MVELNEINKAIRVLKNNCANYKECWDCPLKGEARSFMVGCNLLDEIPSKWEEVKETRDVSTSNTL